MKIMQSFFACLAHLAGKFTDDGSMILLRKIERDLTAKTQRREEKTMKIMQSFFACLAHLAGKFTHDGSMILLRKIERDLTAKAQREIYRRGHEGAELTLRVLQ